MKEIMASKKFKLGISFVGILFLIGLISLFWTPNDYRKTYDNILGFDLISGPSLQFPLGTDANGRCILSRLMVSLRRIFTISIFSVLLSMGLGGTLGFISGYFEGKIDSIISSLINVFNSIPDILFILVFLSIFGTSNITLIFTIGFLGFVSPCRLIRASVKKSKNSDYIAWGKNIGASSFRIITSHLLIDVLPTILVSMATLFSSCVLIESAISYLGFISPDTASLGKMLADSMLYFTYYPAITFIIAGVIIMLVLGFNLIADSINTYLYSKGNLNE